MKVLVADDDRVARRMLTAILDEWGYETATASNGLEAWDLLRQPDGPRFAILDSQMPGLDGVEVCRRVRALPGLHGVKPLTQLRAEKKTNSVQQPR